MLPALGKTLRGEARGPRCSVGQTAGAVALQDVSPAVVSRAASAGCSEQDFATCGLKSWATCRVRSGPSFKGTAGPGIATVVDAALVFGQSARDCAIAAGSDEFLGSGISYPPARSGHYR